MSDLTQERLKELLSYDPITGDWTWITRRQGIRIGQLAGSEDDNGYRRIKVDGAMYLAHRLAFLYMVGRWPSNLVDHKNVTPSDNSWGNLRECDGGQNLCNSAIRSDNSSGVKGVSWSHHNGMWHGQVKFRGQHLSKYFQHNSMKDAVAWVEATRKELHGKFARSS